MANIGLAKVTVNKYRMIWPSSIGIQARGAGGRVAAAPPPQTRVKPLFFWAEATTKNKKAQLTQREARDSLGI